jgi:fatty acid desaturase
LLEIFALGELAYHHIHHLNINVPFYNLLDCHESYGSKNWEKLKIFPVSAKEAFKCLTYVMYDE